MPTSEFSPTQTDVTDPSETNADGRVLQTALNRISEVAAPAANYIAISARQAGQALTSAAYKANDALGAAGEQLNDVQERLTEDCRNYIRAKPMTAIGIAVLAGFFLSSLLGRDSQN